MSRSWQKWGARRAGFRVIAAASALFSVSIAAERPPGQWAEVTIDDLHFIRGSLRENHPGPLDDANPAFRDWYVRGFEAAVERAGRVDSYEGYFFTIQNYMTGFQDNHLGAHADDRFDPSVRLRRRWPGFLIGLDAGGFRVVNGSPRGPPAGAALESCDGRAADALADEILRPYFPLWSLRGTRPRHAPFLLIDEGNPFVRLPAECRFRTREGPRIFRLQWTAIDNAALAERVRAAQGRIEAATGLRRFGRNGWWIRLASFNANSDEAAAPLLALIRNMETEPAAFREADLIVFDVRGNTGGNSEFGNRVAAALWGPALVASAPRAVAEDWRVSAANVRQIERSNLPALANRFGAEDPRTLSYGRFAREMSMALDRGDPFYRLALTPAVSGGVLAPVRARIFLLTDGWCGSACLDFADLVLAVPGVTHVGAETSADTVYIDNTGARLPSGEGFLGWSMKVIRGRPRAHNQSYVPHHVWSGSMTDTPGLERWILQLTRR